MYCRILVRDRESVWNILSTNCPIGASAGTDSENPLTRVYIIRIIKPFAKAKPFGWFGRDMHLTPERVDAEYEWTRRRASTVVPIINKTRDRLGELFETEVDGVSEAAYKEEVDTVFADGAVAVNVAGYVGLLRELDVEGDYPGFIVDEILGRELAATIAGGQPLALLAQATFHFADVHTHGTEGENAGVDDLDAALAAGFQTRLPGWEWRETESPFSV